MRHPETLTPKSKTHIVAKKDDHNYLVISGTTGNEYTVTLLEMARLALVIGQNTDPQIIMVAVVALTLSQHWHLSKPKPTAKYQASTPPGQPLASITARF